MSNKILILDPSFRAFGWIVLENGQPLEWGCFKTSKEKQTSTALSDHHRLEEITTKLLKVIEDQKPTEIITEIPFGTQNSAASRALYACRGLIYGIALTLKLKYVPITPNAAKIALAGKSFAEKDEMLLGLKIHFPKFDSVINKESLYLRETLADCMGIYLAYKNNQTLDNEPQKEKRIRNLRPKNSPTKGKRGRNNVPYIRKR